LLLVGGQSARACDPGATVVPHYPHGALVTSVTPGGIADAARLQVGDIIISVNDVPINSQQDLDAVIGPCPPVIDFLFKRLLVRQDPPANAKTPQYQTLHSRYVLPGKKPKK
jgi:hypothetical protein